MPLDSSFFSRDNKSPLRFFDTRIFHFDFDCKKDMVNPICTGCCNQIRHGKKFKVGQGIEKVFWSARLLCHVNSHDTLCQQCHFKFFSWKKEMINDFVDIMVDENEKDEYDMEIDDSNVS